MRGIPMSRIAERCLRSANAAGIGLLLLAAGCTSCGDARCGVEPGRPAFGEKSTKWFQSVLRLPSWEAKDAAMRSDRVAEFGRTWWIHRGVETERTGHSLGSTGSWLSNEFSERGGLAGDWLASGWDRAGEDSCCFVPRWWHTIKLAAE